MATGVGLFGKTQFRRDFLSVGLPRPLMALWEGWLTRALARSRERTGTGWTPLFLTMPVWHAVLGRSLGGAAAIVATMPSMDGAGRCFPLSVLAWSDDPDAAVTADGSAWSDTAEAFLLGTLDEAGSHEAVMDTLGRLPVFPAARPGEAAAVGAGDSLWWTHGGERHAPERFAVTGMPGEAAFAAMIGGTPASAAAGEGQLHAG